MVSNNKQNKENISEYHAFLKDDAGGLINNLEYDQSKNSSLGLLPGNKLDLEDEMPTSYSWQSVPPTTTTQPNITAGSLNISEGFPWERIILGEVTPAKLLPDMSNIESWRQDPSFCSGKIRLTYQYHKFMFTYL